MSRQIGNQPELSLLNAANYSSKIAGEIKSIDFSTVNEAKEINRTGPAIFFLRFLPRNKRSRIPGLI